MQAAYIDKFGPSSEIKIGELPRPQIMNDEILIKTIATSVNYVDTFVRSGSFKTKVDFPLVIGRNAVGKVVETNDNEFKPGELVWTNSMGYDGRAGTTSEYVAVPCERLFHLDKSLDPIKVVASLHSSATAAILLNDVLNVQADQSLLVEGAGGHVGQKLVTLAKDLDLKVSTTSNSNDFSTLQALGVENTYDYHQDVSDITERFDYLIDTSGKIKLTDNVDLLNVFGKIGLITTPPDALTPEKIAQLYTHSQALMGFVISHATVDQLQDAAHLITTAFSQGKLLDDDVLTLPFNQAEKAHRLLENHENAGKKIILKF